MLPAVAYYPSPHKLVPSARSCQSRLKSEKLRTRVPAFFYHATRERDRGFVFTREFGGREQPIRRLAWPVGCRRLAMGDIALSTFTFYVSRYIPTIHGLSLPDKALRDRIKLRQVAWTLSCSSPPPSCS